MMIYYSNFKPKSKKEKIISAVLYIVFGVLFIIIPGIIAKSFTTFIGIALLAFGLYKLTFSLMNRVGYGYISSALLLILGLVIILNHSAASNVILLLIGFSVTFMGINKLVYSFMLKNTYKYWYVNTIIGALILALGLVMCFNPFSTMNVFIIILGVALTIYGITKLISAFNKKEEIKEEDMHQFFDSMRNHSNKHNNDDAIDADFTEKK